MCEEAHTLRSNESIQLAKSNRERTMGGGISLPNECEWTEAAGNAHGKKPLWGVD